MDKPFSFRIITEPRGPGKGHWFFVRVYETEKDLQDAAHAYRPYDSRASWNRVLGCVQAVPYRERVKSNGKLETIPPPNKFCGVVRILKTCTYEQVAHEMLHASLALYRLVVRPNANFWRNCNQSEEDICYIHGELSDMAFYNLSQFLLGV